MRYIQTMLLSARRTVPMLRIRTVLGSLVVGTLGVMGLGHCAARVPQQAPETGAPSHSSSEARTAAEAQLNGSSRISRHAASASPASTSPLGQGTEHRAPGAPEASASATAFSSLPTDQGPGGSESDYDLAKDLELRSAEARRDLGFRTELATVHDTFLMAAPRRSLGGTLPLLNKVFEAYFNGRFTVGPKRAISVYLFPNERRYEAYCQLRWKRSCISIYGFYLGDEHRIVMNVGLGVGTLTHELVHPILQADFPEAPMWFEEGVASLYEHFGFTRPGEIIGLTNWRLGGLRQGFQSASEHSSLPHLFGLSDQEFRDDSESLHYAAARYLCQWLDQKGKLWPFYKEWRSSVSRDPTGQKSFETIMGMTPGEANAPWMRWVSSLKE